ncbi:acylphosphatase [Limosilactobacillus coleohominis]|uniref:Acylphosphatase n=1 Tax=Limosilactobacillus coleohominis TaxID=181675 RepID=A0ABS2GVH1_9LACO|nr:acylphosphatase [Limosilactobacillus coleohominis]MBM6940275.1 acylphosphatase [Limosilactobacillus coleohominis]MBM6955047.1 acylphosphatase [Limosilactobacillus coleohominis]HJA22956.1 acylphosphatase [Candidatus Limosilactobacillus intestinavium]
MINYHLTVSGRVQGVGFRWSTYQLAKQLGLTGYVQNLMNGDVYIVVQGPHETVRKFVNQVKECVSPYSRVDKVQIKPGNLIDDHDFSIKETW